MMKNWIKSVLRQQSAKKRKKVDIDLKIESHSFKPDSLCNSADKNLFSSVSEVDDNLANVQSANSK
ncbi:MULTISPECIES: hypothetical protein [unclassified Shewanella]|uniref:hypothetical protein n=1 Tax=unclassified Shewanella TaxID=196818 RepID=UPI000C854B50|nr:MULTISPECIES: hypothetical protein [unclassified Shewanella]MDO6619527.1 hypothetical protein [Shewanella sp. 6_MG-2023]MDO6641243.1 hypothetical protein [Shewanella sp. 5_MG-2023]MDO6679443.1 hypothetical protein [Shewanella sp. 4_MG-2023]MDO6775822.1 hypothetical protein [Shewanella sp. 3_MG-2023]PMG29823.1 hypothetical protein BCU94_12925 [Shewanella sp. 10N.286.52.C2]